MSDSILKRIRNRAADLISTRSAVVAPVGSINNWGGGILGVPGGGAVGWIGEHFPDQFSLFGYDLERITRLRRYSRILFNENANLSKFAKVMQVNVIGKNISRPTFRNVDAGLQESVADWWLDRYNDVVSENGWNGLDTELAMLNTWVRDGDATGAWVEEESLRPLLRLYNGDDYYETDGGGRRYIWRGIIYHGLTLRPLVYVFKRKRLKDIPARINDANPFFYFSEDVVHFYTLSDSSNIRGVPPVAPAIIDIVQTQAFDRNTGAAMSFLSKIPIIRKHMPRSNPDNFAPSIEAGGFSGADAMTGEGKENLEKANEIKNELTRLHLASNVILDEEMGKEWVIPKFDIPASYVSGFRAAKTIDIAMGLGISAIMLTDDASKSNYSSARAAMIHDQAYFALFHERWCRLIRTPIFRRLIARELLPGGEFYRISDDDKERLMTPRWQAPAPEHIDPLKSVNAIIAAKNAGLMSAPTAAGRLGLDYKEEVGKEVAARLIEKEAGLSTRTPPMIDNKDGADDDSAESEPEPDKEDEESDAE